jgi:hypothetical protein
LAESDVLGLGLLPRVGGESEDRGLQDSVVVCDGVQLGVDASAAMLGLAVVAGVFF